MDAVPAISTHNLDTGYKSKGKEAKISINVNETLWSGELTCLLGRNGSGKSTILKTLSAFIPPLSGEVRILGKSLSDYSPLELAKLIGVVLTDRISLTNLTVRELVATGRSPYTGYWGTLSSSDREIVDSAMSMVRIEGLADRRIATLSDGERQKAMIAKALAQETPVIFLDEPTAFLDYPSKVETLLLLRDLAKSQAKTIFLSTHDIEVALQIADKLWLMDKQKGIVTGTPPELARSGDIGRFFSTEGVKFDPDTMRFKVEN